MMKRELFLFSFHDHTGITQHLEKMVLKGWLLDRTGFFWKYRSCEPQSIRYAVTYFPDTEEASKKEALFRGLCQEAGWEFVTTYKEMQIFRSSLPYPVPLDTEPMVQVETIHKGMKGGYLNHLFWTLFYPLIFYFRLYLAGDVTGYLPFLASTPYLLSILGITVYFVVNLWELITYYRWRRRAKAAAREGQFLPTTDRRWPHVAERGTFLVLLVCLIWALVLYFAPRSEDYPDNKYDMGPLHYAIYYDEMPLYMNDLADVPGENYSNKLEKSRSPFLGRTQGSIELRYDRRQGNDDPRELDYTVWSSRFDPLLDLAQEEEQNSRWNWGTYQSIPSAAGAQAAWQLYEDGAPQEQYLLRFEDRVIEIEFSFSPTPEQMATAIKKLLEH